MYYPEELVEEIRERNDIVVGVISGKNFDISVGVLNIFTFIAAANGMYAIVSASNDLYKIPNSSQIKDRFRSFIILLIIYLFSLIYYFTINYGVHSFCKHLHWISVKNRNICILSHFQTADPV